MKMTEEMTEHQRASALPPLTATMAAVRDESRKWLFIMAILIAVLLMAGATLARQSLRRQPSAAKGVASPELCLHRGVALERVAGAGQGFGPVTEATLPSPAEDGRTEMLDVESGRWVTQPGPERFNGNAVAIVDWIRANGVHISGRVWPDGSAACVTYNLTILPVESRRWVETAADSFPDLPVLASGLHSPRRQLVLRGDLAQTYVFRTDEGTLGMLRVIGSSADERIVRIRYKLLQAGGQ